MPLLTETNEKISPPTSSSTSYGGAVTIIEPHLAEAEPGLGQKSAARELLEKALELDAGHPLAADLLAEPG